MPIVVFFNRKIVSFYCELGEKVGRQTFLNKYTEAVISRESLMHSLFDTGLNTCCYMQWRIKPVFFWGGGQLVGPRQTLPTPKLVFLLGFRPLYLGNAQK